MVNFRHIALRVQNFADISRKWSQRSQQKSVSQLVVVIIHTKFQLHCMFETEVRWVGHFCPPSA